MCFFTAIISHNVALSDVLVVEAPAQDIEITSVFAVFVVILSFV